MPPRTPKPVAPMADCPQQTRKAASASLRALTTISPADAYAFLQPVHRLMNAMYGLNHPTSVDFIGRIKATGKPIENLTVGELLAIGEQMEADWRDQA